MIGENPPFDSEKMPASREKRAAMGLQKLAPEELARLEAAVPRYHRAEITALNPVAGTAPAAPAADKAGKPGWLPALITLQKTGDKPEKADAFETRIAGEFGGWSGHTSFKLLNGQIWQQTAGESYSGDRQVSPKAKIYPVCSASAGWRSRGAPAGEGETHPARVRSDPGK